LESDGAPKLHKSHKHKQTNTNTTNTPSKIPKHKSLENIQENGVGDERTSKKQTNKQTNKQSVNENKQT